MRKGNIRMNKYLLAAAAILLSGAAAQAQDATGTTDSRVNFSILGGWASHPGLTLGAARPDGGDGFNGGARGSYDLGGTLPISGLSLDADYFYNRIDYNPNSPGRLDSQSFMGDVTYHAPINESWNLYGGSGLGGGNGSLG